MAQLPRPEFFAKPFCIGDTSTEVLVAISFEELDADAVFSFFQNRGAIFPARAVLAVIVHDQFPVNVQL